MNTTGLYNQFQHKEIIPYPGTVEGKQMRGTFEISLNY